MKKLGIVLCLFLTAILTGCTSQKQTSKETVPKLENASTDPWGLTLSAEQITETGLTLVWYQQGGTIQGELMTGEEFQVTQYQDGTWVNVPEQKENMVWNSKAFTIEKGKDTTMSISWKAHLGALPKGTYRLSKAVMDFVDQEHQTTHTYQVQFEVKGKS